MSKPLTGEEILGIDDRKVVKVPCPEWGGHVHVRSLSGEELDQWEVEQYERSRLEKEEGQDKQAMLRNLRARLVSRCACDESGRPLFSPEQASALGQKNGRALKRVFDAARKLNGMTPEDEQELLGNSGGAPSGASGS
jgi:hypothetical protein